MSLNKFKLIAFLTIYSLISSCDGQNNRGQIMNSSYPEQSIKSDGIIKKNENKEQISEVVRMMFQDSKGQIWFGTQGGAFKLIENELIFIGDIKSETGKRVTIKDIKEDRNGKIWIGHTDGLSSVDVEQVTNYYERDGLLNNDVWCITTDRNNQVWIGTIDGVCKFDGKEFTSFKLPKGKIDPDRGVSSKEMVHHIMEDRNGRIFFSTNGGVYIKEGNLLTNLSEKDGLKSDFVNKVLEDKDGSFWICTKDGLYHYVDEVLTNITKDIITSGKGIMTVIQDFEGNIWFNSNLRDIYSFDGVHFEKYRISEDANAPAPFHIYEDKQKRLWFVGFGGAYRYENNQFINITQAGPW